MRKGRICSVIKNNYGGGEVYYCGFLPGLSYIKKGLKELPMGKGGGNQNFCHSAAHHFEIENPDKTAERIILLPLNETGIKPDVISEKGVVCGRLESPSSTVIPVINLSKAKLKNVSIEVKNLKRCRRVWSPFFREGLKYKKLKNEVVITIPELKSADMIIIEK